MTGTHLGPMVLQTVGANRRIRGTAPFAAPIHWTAAESDSPVTALPEPWPAWVEDPCPVVVSLTMLATLHQSGGGWRAVRDRSVDGLLRSVGDDGLWKGSVPLDSIMTTLLVVQGLVAYLPQMPATRGRYVRHVLARTVATLQTFPHDDGVGVTARQNACIHAIQALVGPVIGASDLD